MLFLGGGGSADDERALWIEAFPPGSRIAVVPLAQEGADRRADTVDWFSSAVSTLGGFDVVAWVGDQPPTHDPDVIAVPGGNTFLLLAELRRTGLEAVISEFVRGGGALYGGSAGAVLMGADIDIALVADSNEVGLEDTRGLDLLGGADALPHYTADQLGFARDRAREGHRSVIGIPEDAGVVVEGGAARNVGPGTVSVVTPTGDVDYAPRASWPL